MSDAATFESIDTLIRMRDFGRVINWGVGTGIRTYTAIGPLKFIVGLGNFAQYPGSENPRINVCFTVGKDFRYTR